MRKLYLSTKFPHQEIGEITLFFAVYVFLEDNDWSAAGSLVLNFLFVLLSSFPFIHVFYLKPFNQLPVAYERQLSEKMILRDIW